MSLFIFRERTMVMISATDETFSLPYAIAIVVASSAEEAEEHGRRELAPYLEGHSYDQIEAKEIGKLEFGPLPTTIFLYSKDAGRIK